MQDDVRVGEHVTLDHRRPHRDVRGVVRQRLHARTGLHHDLVTGRDEWRDRVGDGRDPSFAWAGLRGDGDLHTQAT
ncbi:hypothetical protein GCM10023145_13620 [Angustibacter luteus]